MDIPHKNVTLVNMSEGEQIIVSLRPEWCLIKSKVFDEGITNKIYGYIDETSENKNEMILLRVYGNNTDLIIDRKRELDTHIKLNKAGFATQVYCTVNNGYFYGYVDGNTLSAETVRDPQIAPIIAQAIARMHCSVPGEGEPIFQSTLQKWLRLVPDYFTAVKLKVLKSAVENKAALSRELRALDQKIRKHPNLETGFCHNDLLLGNIIYNDDMKTISVIDYEYGNSNYLAFDVGNHFNEYVGVETMNFKLYPDETYQRWWLRFYLEEFHRCKSLGAVTEEHITQLYNQVNFFSLCGHLFWATWGIIQALNSDIAFDYADYSRMKFEEYFNQKEKFFDLL